MEILSDNETTEEGVSESIKDAFFSSIPMWNKLNSMSKGYNSATARLTLRENDPRIRQAAEALINGYDAVRKRITKEIVAEGNFSLDAVIAAINAEAIVLRRKSN